MLFAYSDFLKLYCNNKTVYKKITLKKHKCKTLKD